MSGRKWEYCFRFVVLSPESGVATMKAFVEDTLNPEGSRGWEVIGVFPAPTGHDEVFVVMKRPVST